MSITTSVIVEDHAQIDGRRAVRERHTDHLGVFHFASYLAQAADNASTIMAARVAILEAHLAATEMAQNIAFIMVGAYGSVTTNHISVADARAAIRALYQTGSGEIIGRLAGYLLTLSDATLRTLFSMTQSQVNQLKTRLQGKVDALNAVLTAVGE